MKIGLQLGYTWIIVTTRLHLQLDNNYNKFTVTIELQLD